MSARSARSSSGSSSIASSASSSSSHRAPPSTMRARRRPALLALPALLLGVLLVLAHASPAHAWYLPGSAPNSYRAGDVIPFNVNRLVPAASQQNIKSVYNLDYYHPALHFCPPRDPASGAPVAPIPQSEGLGSVLMGDRIYNSPMSARVLKNESCIHICTSEVPQTTGQGDAHFVNGVIDKQYVVNWMIDGLPVAQENIIEETHETWLSVGFFLGSTLDSYGKRLQPPALHNHFEVYIDYHERSPGEYRIVGAVVYPMSIKSLSSAAGGQPNCRATGPLQLSESPGSRNQVAYTMSTYWRPSPVPWATRWDSYLKVFDPRIHWLSLVNSIVIDTFLCIMVAMILVRSISRDLTRYNAIDLTEDVQEDFGWKLVHGEVFRPPSSPMFLSIMVGTGAQLIGMACATLLFAALGFTSPSNRGSIATVMIVTWTLFGFLAGWVGMRVYASLGGDNWKRTIFLQATLFPSLIFAIVNLLNFFLVFSASSGAVPFGTLLALVALWFLINVPLTLLGSYLGMRKGGFTQPTRVNQIPRQIPPTVWYLRPLPSALLGGILPFLAAFVELFFLLNSLFGTKVYYAFGFCALTFGATALTVATITILLCYSHLCAEEYRWHWRAFTTGGGCAFWLFAYGLFYWATRLDLPGIANKVLFLGYLSLISLLTFLLFGSIGFSACFWACRRLYQAIRVD
ncbi:Transmembrane 9 superfamily member 2 [Tilletia horrida]|uniref:Transmembrane 9 superfamily member n=1 Tax=Tilletia horrida TaxID=155126 RepID=A0AAN6JLZ0_9BASI|nr:Transmembrane 9 superfamily member 2 [Tilletia horrida]